MITDNTVSPRVVDFILHLEAENMNPKDIEFKITVYPNANTPLVDLSLGADETITTELVTSDFDLDGIYEIIVGASNGNLYIYNHPDSTSYHTNDPINCTPAIGDVNNDGYEEIVFGNDNGNVYVLDKDGNLIHQYQVNGMCKHAIVLEDVTGNGQLEIIVSTWKYPGNATGMDGFYIIDPINFNMYSYDTSYRIQRPFSVSDVNNDSIKEIVVPLKDKYFESHNEDTNSHIKFFTISPSFEMEKIWEIVDYYQYASGPILSDIDDDGIVEILVNFDWPSMTGPPEGHDNWLRAYRFEESNYIWDIKLSDGYYIPKEQLISGDYLDNIDGFEIITSNHEFYSIIDCNGNLIRTLCTYNNYGSCPTPMIFSDINSDGNQELLIITNSSFLALDDDTNYLEEWRICTDELNPFVSISLGNVIGEYDNEIVLITQNGTIYAFPIEYSTTSTSEWAQYQNNSRNTGSYFQPLPEVITQDITVRHNAIIDKEIRFSEHDVEARLMIEPGNEILFKPSGLIEGRNVQAIGTENNPIIFSGICADTTKNYWEGISIFGCDEAQFEHCTITNAEIGIFMENTENNVIKDCTIMYNDIGISLFTSSPFIRKNNISYNNYGIAGFHKSMPILSNLDTLGVPFINAVVENEINIFLDESGAYLDNGYNDIYSTFDNYIVLENYPDRYLNARNNYWNSTDIEEIYTHLIPPETFVIEPICEEPNWKSSNPYLTPENQKLGEGYSYLLAGDYNNAATSFNELITQYPETHESDLGVVGLYSCYIGFKNQWSVLESYLDTLLVNPMNSETTEKLLVSYRNLCLRNQEEYTNAILNYESILDNDPSYEDSCYAVIDIGNTYLEAQYAGKTAMGKYSNLIPKSYSTHQEFTKYLLKSVIDGQILPSNNSGIFDRPVLFQSYPNPCLNTTNIDYFIPQSLHVTLKIYNLKGQFVKKIYDGTRESGRYSSVWDGTDYNNKKLGNGVYFYKLDAGKYSTIKKLIMMR